MNLEEAKSVVKQLAATWRTDLNEAEALVWMDTLGDLQPAHARAAVRALSQTADFMPSHAEFLRVYNRQKTIADEQHETQMLGTTGGASCDCEGGFTEVEGPGALTLRRCARCNPAPPADNSGHPKNCTCLTCSYGPARAASIRRGGDGYRKSTATPAGPTLLDF